MTDDAASGASPATPPNVASRDLGPARDCANWPRVAPAERHAQALVEWLDETDLSGRAEPSGRRGWTSARSWLALAAGLVEVKIDTSPPGPGAFMCSIAWPYEDAANETASGYHTELTRLLYSYAALENAVRACAPAGANAGASTYELARKLLAGAPDLRLPHAHCAAEHVREHVLAEPALAGDARLLRGLNWAADSDPRLRALNAGLQMRHLLAHGAIPDPLPAPVSDGDDWHAGAAPDICMATGATTCLLLTIQALAADAPASACDFHVDEGVWLPDERGGGWVHEFSSEARLRTLHLQDGLQPGRETSVL